MSLLTNIAGDGVLESWCDALSGVHAMTSCAQEIPPPATYGSHPILALPPTLPSQNLETLDPAALTPLTPEVISRQATINIGTIGHVAHGKSTVVKAISGVQVRLAEGWGARLKIWDSILPSEYPT